MYLLIFFIFPDIRKVTQGINRFRHLLRVVETKATFGLRKVHTEVMDGLKQIYFKLLKKFTLISAFHNRICIVLFGVHPISLLKVK